MHLDFERFADDEATQKWSTQLSDNLPHEMVEVLMKTNKPRHYGLFESKDDNVEQALQLFTVAEQETVSQSDPGGLRIACILSNTKDIREKKEFQPVWNGYLRLFNLFQFLPYGLFATKEGMEL